MLMSTIEKIVNSQAASGEDGADSHIVPSRHLHTCYDWDGKYQSKDVNDDVEN